MTLAAHTARFRQQATSVAGFEVRTSARPSFPSRAAHPRLVPSVRDFVVPAPVRFAEAVATAAIVRDVAAFAALVVLATMFSVLSGLDFMA